LQTINVWVNPERDAVKAEKKIIEKQVFPAKKLVMKITTHALHPEACVC